MRNHQHDNCGTCGRTTNACPECAQPYPGGIAGWWDGSSWHTGPRPVETPRPRALVAAERTVQLAQDAYDAADREWQRTASAHHQARQRDARTRQPVVKPDGTMVEVGTVDPAVLHRLDEAEQAAKERRDIAGRDLVAARQQLHAATRTTVQMK